MHTSRRRSRRPLAPVAVTTALVLAGAVAPGAASAVTAQAVATIAEVQGTGTASTLVGQAVTVEGVVTADHTGAAGYGGLYVQTPGSGGPEDATTGASDGIFVFLGAATTTATVGDRVSVTGVVGESFGLTRIDASGAGGSVTPVEGDVVLPVPTELPADAVGPAREALEGMLVVPTGEYRLSSTHQLARFGTVWLSPGSDLPVTATEVAEPGSPQAQAIAAANRASRILLDDARRDPVSASTQPYLDGDDVVRNGDVVDFPDLPYVLGYDFGDWRLQPLAPLDATAPASAVPTFGERNPRPAAPAPVGGDLQVGAFNVLNYFTTLSTQDPDARGARSPEQLAAQRSKIVAAIRGLGADVVALQEIENSVHFGDGTPDVALADLVAGLNDASGGGWAHVATPAPLVGPGATPTDVIMNAIVYRTAAVTPVGASATLVDETVWDNAREPVAQTFAPVGGGRPFTVVANHFKSKGGDEGDPEDPDGQGFFNADRVAQAQAVASFVAALQDASGSRDVVVLGDLNAYRQEDPIDVLTGAGLVDVVAARAPGDHTYTFDGAVGSLDHALATPSFAARVTGADVWNINSPEWAGLEYFQPFTDPDSVYRSSDHDPIVLGLSAAAAPGAVEIDVLAINDFHGRLEADRQVAGAAVLAGAVAAFRAQNPNTLFVAAGDNIGATTFTSLVQRDEPTIEVLDAMGLDASALGNHEFDRGREDLDERVLPLADFPYLAANLYDRATGAPAFPEYHLETTGGVTVGFIGAVTEDLPSLVTPAGIATLEVRDVVDEVNRVAARLSDGVDANGEADVLILLVHEGAESADVADLTADTAFGRIATATSAEVDAIVSAHTHQQYTHRMPVQGWPAGLTRPVIQSGQYGEALGRLTFSVDPATGDVLAIDAERIDLVSADGTPAYAPDAEVAAIVQRAVEVAAVLGRRSLGRITADFQRARQASGDENRGGESTLGNLVADVQLWATRELGTEIAFMNPGGLRADLVHASSGEGDPAGNVTYKEASDVQPFANTLVTMELTGAQVVQVLEQQWQPAGSSRPFLKLGVSEGLEYVYDPTAPAGQRITRVTLDGVRLDPAQRYTVVVNSFLASGGDNFTAFTQGADVRDSGRVDLQAFVDYMAEFSPVSPDLEQRAVGVHVVNPPADGTWAPGDTVTIRLSSLLFSGGEQQGGTLAVTVDGRPAGTVPIDASVVDTTDEVGRATVGVQIPAAAGDGVVEVVATVAGTGTTVTVPLAVDARPAATPSPAPTPGGTGSRPAPTRSRGSLAVTGSEALGLGGLATALLVAGGGLWATSRRRTQG